MAAVRRRPTGAHVAPRRAVGKVQRSAAPAHGVGRVVPAPISALFLGVIGGSLALVGVLPASTPASAVTAAPATAIVLAADAQPALDSAAPAQPALDSAAPAQPAPASAAPAAPVSEADTDRASRTRRAPAVAEPSPPPVVVPPPLPPPPPPPPVLPGCDGRASTRGANGRLPSSVLCTVPGSGEALRADAAVDFVRLANAYEQHFGRKICLTDGYRTLSEQKAVRRVKPRLAARPGTSEHGLGLAVDLACGVQSFRSPQHAWMRQNAERFGWHHPSWARRGGAKPEPWHWEYVG